MKILAIDPGYERLGVTVMEKKDKEKETLLFSECFFTEAKLPHSSRLALVGAEILRVIEIYKPEALAIETLFFSKNVKTALKVAEARGVILHVAVSAGLSVLELSPAQIKIAVTGHGRSDKKQMISMIPRLIKINKTIEYDDEYDAIAAGITFFAHKKNIYPQI